VFGCVASAEVSNASDVVDFRLELSEAFTVAALLAVIFSLALEDATSFFAFSVGTFFALLEETELPVDVELSFDEDITPLLPAGAADELDAELATDDSADEAADFAFAPALDPFAALLTELAELDALDELLFALLEDELPAELELLADALLLSVFPLASPALDELPAELLLDALELDALLEDELTLGAVFRSYTARRSICGV
jgi:hypothetical protein